MLPAAGMSNEGVFPFPNVLLHNHVSQVVVVPPADKGSGTNTEGQPTSKKKRNLPGTPDPEAEVIALSPKTLMATNRFLCEICGKGFQRDQNLQLHRRGHNLPWKLKQRTGKEPRKRVYVCPERSCIHHHPSRALGDLTGIKKHFCRKHGEKKWKCDKCSKRYAVQSDWKAHSKTCGTREYRCDCGTLFSRRDSFVTHRAFCDALAEETARLNAATSVNHHLSALNRSPYHFMNSSPHHHNNNQNLPQAQAFPPIFKPVNISANNLGDAPDDVVEPCRQPRPDNGALPLWAIDNGPSLQPHMFVDQLLPCTNTAPPSHSQHLDWVLKPSPPHPSLLPQSSASLPSLYSSQHHLLGGNTMSASMSATALLQKAAQMGATMTTSSEDHDEDKLFRGLCDVHQSQTMTGSTRKPSNCDGAQLAEHQSPPSAKRRRIEQGIDAVMPGGQTRDFLGVSAHAVTSNPPSVNRLI
ncbi:hypothetical protein MLD38_020017 [Melastoma candidum]|uniref:Uncharacterized protein n=1 Tax=Melastoma candidum TaxID=119954 RepID=A0ACB9QBT0_9MYRT|nr:hypothetical protein MLD38_020017 [Melastoma candidum]